MAATGEIGPKPLIAIWNTETMHILFECKGVIKKGISALSFSESGKYLVAACINDDHEIAVIDIKAKTTSTFKGGKELILDLHWVTEASFLSVGPKHIVLWDTKGKGSKGDKIPEKTVTCIQKNGGSILLGVLDGNLEIRKDQSL